MEVLYPQIYSFAPSDGSSLDGPGTPIVVTIQDTLPDGTNLNVIVTPPGGPASNAVVDNVVQSGYSASSELIVVEGVVAIALTITRDDGWYEAFDLEVSANNPGHGLHIVTETVSYTVKRWPPNMQPFYDGAVPAG